MDHADAYKSALQLNDLLDEASSNEQSWILQDLAQLPFVRTVCETGFNAGHNAFHILTANYDVVVYSFEVRRCISRFLKMFHFTNRDIEYWLPDMHAWADKLGQTCGRLNCQFSNHR